MKLFSSPSIHSAPKNKKEHVLCKINGLDITDKDVVRMAGIAVYAVILAAWMLMVPTAETVQAAEPETAQVIVADPVVTEEPQEEALVVNTDETLALAMGIDAVVSSIPGGEHSTDVTLIMVGNVVMNRTNDSRFPATVEEVLCQPMQFSCFGETGLKWVGKAASDEAFKARVMKAAERVIDGERLLSQSVVYVSSSRQGAVEAQLDGLYFCR